MLAASNTTQQAERATVHFIFCFLAEGLEDVDPPNPFRILAKFQSSHAKSKCKIEQLSSNLALRRNREQSDLVLDFGP
jgi:hypothetical protein